MRRRPLVPVAALGLGAAVLAVGCSPAETPSSTGTEDGGDGNPTSVVGTAAPAGTAIAGSTTARPEPIAPDAVRQIDFFTFVYPADSCGDVFHEGPSEGYELDGGEAHGGEPDDEDFFSVYTRPEVSYGDLDGDGIQEALVILDCTPGNDPVGFASVWTPGNDPVGFASVWTPDGEGGATRLVQVASNIGTDPGRGDHRLQSATLSDTGINVVWQVFGADDPQCCPTEQAEVTIIWDDGALAAAAPAVYTEAESPG